MKSNNDKSFDAKRIMAIAHAMRENGSVRARKLAFVPAAKYDTGYTSMAGIRERRARIVGYSGPTPGVKYI